MARTMGHRITYAIRRDGQVTLHESRWGALSAPADVFWGAEATEAFIRSNSPSERWYDDCWGEGGIALDYDTKTVAFFGVYDYSDELRRFYERLAGVIWGPEWTLRWVDDMPDIAAQVGVDRDLVTSMPMHATPELIGKGYEQGQHRGLVSVREDGNSRDIVFDQLGAGLLMLGTDALGHLHRGMEWRAFCEFHATRPLLDREKERPLMAPGFQDFVQLDLDAKTIAFRSPRDVPEYYAPDFLERVYSRRWPGWSVQILDGGIDEHFASMDRELPEELRARPPAPEPRAEPVWDEPERGPMSFDECVAEIAGFLFDNESIKQDVTELAQRVAEQVKSDAQGPVSWGAGFFDSIPHSGPERADKLQRFGQAVEQLHRDESLS